MRFLKYLLIILFAFSEIHCSNKNNTLEENKNGNSSITEKNLEKNQTKYLFAVIYHKRGTYESGSDKSGFVGAIENYLYYSEIIEATHVNETVKYKILDNLENELRNKFRLSVYSITKRECLVFDTYIEASEYRRKIRDQR